MGSGSNLFTIPVFDTHSNEIVKCLNKVENQYMLPRSTMPTRQLRFLEIRDTRFDLGVAVFANQDTLLRFLNQAVPGIRQASYAQSESFCFLTRLFRMTHPDAHLPQRNAPSGRGKCFVSPCFRHDLIIVTL